MSRHASAPWTLFAAFLLVSVTARAAPAPAPRAARLSGGAAGAVQVQSDPRYTNFVYYTSASGAEVGVWQGHGRARKAGDVPVLNRDDYSELMFILEGSVTLAEPDGPELVLEPGDAVVVPRGVAYYWRLAETQRVKKYYVAFDHAKDAPALPFKHIVRMAPTGPARIGLDEVDGALRGYTYYASAQGGRAGVWQAAPSAAPARGGPRDHAEVMFVIRGQGTLMLPDRTTLAFQARDVVLVPPGAVYQGTSADLRMYRVSFDPVPLQRAPEAGLP